jgi:hypothetical protein
MACFGTKNAIQWNSGSINTFMVYILMGMENFCMGDFKVGVNTGV